MNIFKIFDAFATILIAGSKKGSVLLLVGMSFSLQGCVDRGRVDYYTSSESKVIPVADVPQISRKLNIAVIAGDDSLRGSAAATVKSTLNSTNLFSDIKFARSSSDPDLSGLKDRDIYLYISTTDLVDERPYKETGSVVTSALLDIATIGFWDLVTPKHIHHTKSKITVKYRYPPYRPVTQSGSSEVEYVYDYDGWKGTGIRLASGDETEEYFYNQVIVRALNKMLMDKEFMSNF